MMSLKIRHARLQSLAVMSVALAMFFVTSLARLSFADERDAFDDELHAIESQQIGKAGRDQVITAYEQLLKKYPDHPHRSQAMLLLASAWQVTIPELGLKYEPRFVIHWLREARAAAPQESQDWCQAMFRLNGAICGEHPAEGRRILQELIDYAPDTVVQVHALYELQSLERMADDLDEAERICLKIQDWLSDRAHLPKEMVQKGETFSWMQSSAQSMMFAYAEMHDVPKAERAAKIAWLADQCQFNRAGEFREQALAHLDLLTDQLNSISSDTELDDAPIRRIEDVVYGRKHGMALTLDVFQPEEPNGCGLLFLVNGGWLSSKATPLMVTIRPEIYEVYLQRGYTVFAVVTSSQPKFTIREEMDDVQRAVRFVRANAEKFGVRPDRLGVLGSSSGGHLTLSIATQGRPGNPETADPVDRESSEVQAAACFFPPTDFLNYGGPGKSGLGEGPLAPLAAAFSSQPLSAEEKQQLGRAISPIYHVTSKLPPTLIIHGDADDVVPLQQSEIFVACAKEVGAPPVELIIRPGKAHGWGDFWKSAEDVSAFADWFDRHLRDRVE